MAVVGNCWSCSTALTSWPSSASPWHHAKCVVPVQTWRRHLQPLLRRTTWSHDPHRWDLACPVGSSSHLQVPILLLHIGLHHSSVHLVDCPGPFGEVHLQAIERVVPGLHDVGWSRPARRSGPCSARSHRATHLGASTSLAKSLVVVHVHLASSAHPQWRSEFPGWWHGGQTVPMGLILLLLVAHPPLSGTLPLLLHGLTQSNSASYHGCSSMTSPSMFGGHTVPPPWCRPVGPLHRPQSFASHTHSCSPSSSAWWPWSSGWDDQSCHWSEVFPGLHVGARGGTGHHHWRTPMMAAYRWWIGGPCQWAHWLGEVHIDTSCAMLFPAPTAGPTPRRLGSWQLLRPTPGLHPWFLTIPLHLSSTLASRKWFPWIYSFHTSLWRGSATMQVQW